MQICKNRYFLLDTYQGTKELLNVDLNSLSKAMLKKIIFCTSRKMESWFGIKKQDLILFDKFI